MSERLKNCPSCGGTLNDDGRCPYCNSKVYDLSDITIDPNSHDIIKLKIKCGDGKYFIVDCYPSNVTWEQHSEPMSYRNESGALYFHNYVESRFTLELVALNGR